MHLFIGDSFIGIFTLVKNPHIQVLKLKAATAKGLGKGNEKANKILKTLRNHKVGCVVSNFGQVDVHFSYFYKACKLKAIPDIDEFCKSVIDSYFSFLKRFVCKRLIVIGVYPNPVKDEYIVPQLLSYGIINEGEIDRIPKQVLQRDHRHMLRRRFNYLLREQAVFYGMTYYDLDDELLDAQGNVKTPFLDISSYNVHLRWEPLLLRHMSKLSECGIKAKFLVDIDSSSTNYLKEKKERMEKRHQSQLRALRQTGHV